MQDLIPPQAQATLAQLSMGDLLALAAALGWASGVRLYLVVFLTGACAYLQWLPFDLPTGLAVLQHPLMLAASFSMLCVEFLADKVPGIDSVWDMLNALIRVPAGAALAAGVFGADSATMGTVAALLGGSLAAASFTTKAATRLAINTSPEPLSNIGVSLLEDGLVVGVLWLAATHPILLGVALVLILSVSALLLWLLSRFLRALFVRLRGFFSTRKSASALENLK